MGTVILTTQNPDIVGGAQNLMQDMAEATNGKIVYTRNPFKKVPYATLSEPPFWKFSIDADFFIFMDDITQWYLFNHSDVPHIRYFNTPRRAFYDMQYFSPRWVRALGFAYRPIDRSFVKKYVKNIASNSHNIRNRVYKTYQRDSRVIYPCVHTEKYYNAESKDYWLSVGRVDKWKRIDLQIEAFRLMPSESLRIVGPVYPGYEYLKDSAPENVQFMNSVSGSELINLYAHSKGLIATAIDEDFGITPLEAMASGKPTVAVREGGYQETVIPWETGLLTDPTPEKLAEAINFAGMWRWYPQEIQQVARKFDYNIFKYFINKFISSVKDNSDRAV